MGCEYINSQKLDYYIYKNNAVIIDLRDKNEYMRYHIRGALNVEYDEMESAINELERNHHITDLTVHLKQYDRNTIIILYCERGSSSMMLCSRLARKGYDVKTLIGGIRRYKGENLISNKK